MTNIPVHTATATNLALHAPIGAVTFDVAGAKTFDQIGTDVFTRTITNQAGHTA